MPRVPRIEKLGKPLKQWSMYPEKPLPFHIPEWRTKKVRGNHIKLKAKHPAQIPKVTPIKDWAILRNDLVEVMVGPDTGKQGIVRAVARLKNQLKVIGMNLEENFLEDMGDGKPGYVLNEMPLHYYEVKLVDPVTGKGTDVYLRNDENGNRVRVCKETERTIPKPPAYPKKDPEKAEEGPLDTKSDVVQEYTYMPSLLLFHEEIMKEMDIPMSIPKTTPERRDLIMKEIIEDVENEGPSEITATRPESFW